MKLFSKLFQIQIGGIFRRLERLDLIVKDKIGN